MRSVIYKITYKPHLGTNFPKFYVGSKYNYNENHFYMGSVASSIILDFTEGKSLKNWWSNKTTNEKENFHFEILEEFLNISPKELLVQEKRIQEKLGVLGEQYFNRSIATIGWCSLENDEAQKKKKSEATKKFWSSKEGQKKKERLAKRNKKTKSKEMLEHWNNISEEDYRNFCKKMKGKGRPKGSKDKNYNNPRRQKRWVSNKKETLRIDAIFLESYLEKGYIIGRKFK